MWARPRCWLMALCVMTGGALAQPAAPIVLQRSRIIASDTELLRLREQPRLELQRLEAEQRAACRPAPASENCKSRTLQLQQRRAVLQARIEFASKHVPAAHASNCKGCHSSPGATPAHDPPPPPIVGVLPKPVPGAAPAHDPMRPPVSGGGTITPPATKCFIASAAYGSPQTREVAALRRFRDEQLLHHEWGRVAVAWYYELSPPIAEYIADKPRARAAVRAVLTPIVWAVGHVAAFVVAAALALVLALWWRHLRRRRISA